MNIKNKYFTPDIEDLKVGYICESTTMPSSWNINDCNDVDNSDDIWEVEPISESRLCNIIKYSMEEEGGIQRFIRTPFLTKEDIEKEGWIYSGIIATPNGGIINHQLNNFKYRTSYNYNSKILEVYEVIKDVYKEDLMIFRGICRCINDFRTICKLLNI